MASEDNGGNVVWFVAGMAIGATVALLFAPASGEEMRKIIGRKTREGREALTSGGRDALDKGRELYDKGRKLADEAADLFERGRKLVEG